VGGTHHLGDLQYAIMRVLWDEGEATVSRVQERLSSGDEERDRALTTIATMLTKMEKKGVVAHKSAGRQFVYRAKIEEKDVHRSMVADLTQRLFRGDFSALVSHLLTEQEIDKKEVERLKALIAERSRETDKGGKEKRRGR
jgi:BlaI family transcriptional regulator, penicillinase repressor